MPWWAYKDATQRLDRMIRIGRRGLADPKARFTYKLVQPPERRIPLLTPARFGDMILGSDGKPIGGSR